MRWCAALREALLLHPCAVNQLIEKLNEKSNAVFVDAEWSRILGHAHFAADAPDSAGLRRLLDIFVGGWFVRCVGSPRLGTNRALSLSLPGCFTKAVCVGALQSATIYCGGPKRSRTG